MNKVRKLFISIIIFFLASCAFTKTDKLVGVEIKTPESIRIQYKSLLQNYNNYEYADFDELYIGCNSCQGEVKNSFCDKIEKFTNQIQFYLMASYKPSEDTIEQGDLYTKLIGFLGVYEKQSFSKNSYIDFTEDVKLTYTELKDSIVYSDDDIVIINFIKYLDEDSIEIYFSDFQGKESVFKDLLLDFVKNHLVGK